MCYPAAVVAPVAGKAVVGSGLLAGTTVTAGTVAASTATTAAVATGAGIAATGAAAGGTTLLTFGNVLTGLSLVGTAIQAFGTFRQSRAASGIADYRSGISDNNAIIAEQNAQLALEQGVADVEDKRLETKQKIGFERARLAAMGFFVDEEGSSVEILSDIAVLGELDALRITADAENKARNFRQQADNFRAEAGLGRLASKNIKKAGDIDTLGTLVTGAANTGTTFLATRTT